MIRRTFGRILSQSTNGAFMSETQIHLATVKAKLATAEADVIEASEKLRTAAFASALSDDPNDDPGLAAQQWLEKVTAHRDRLILALSLAEQAEHDRIARRSSKGHQRLRASSGKSR